MTTKTKKHRIKVGDVVREKGGDDRIGVVTHVFKHEPIAVVLWVPSNNEGVAHHFSDLIVSP